MKPINLYILTRINHNDLFFKYEMILSNKEKISKIRQYEKESIQSLVSELLGCGATLKDLDGFYCSYEIPQMGKEYDLLKICDNCILNIELKSQNVGIQEIKEQLINNKHYLKHFQCEKYLFTFIASTNECYFLSNDNQIEGCSIKKIFEVMKLLDNYYNKDLNEHFRVCNFLISPLNTPDEFLKNNYFLTPHQENIKKDILENTQKRNYKFISITGNAGTGKILLLYDIAKNCSKIGKSCIIHCGILSKGHMRLNNKIDSLDIIPAKELKSDFGLSQYKYIFIDETHRMHKHQFLSIIDLVENSNLICIFSSDSKQVLSTCEVKNNIYGMIKSLPNLKEYKLKDKIRTNKELASFIIAMLDLNKKKNNYKFRNVNLMYASTEEEAQKIIQFFKAQNYTFINYTSSSYKSSSFNKYGGDYNTHHVIGQEFDNVLMHLDKNFYYNEYNKLVAKEHPNPDYLFTQLLFQGLTRVREKLAILIVDNIMLFEKISSILEESTI